MLFVALERYCERADQMDSVNNTMFLNEIEIPIHDM